MRKLTLTILSFIFICSSTELHQFIRLPFLVQHYRHHKAEEPGMSIFAFLKDHYQGEQDNEEDSKDDAQLPLRSTDPILHLGQFISFDHPIEIRKPVYIVRTYFAIPDPALEAGSAISVFQPPRQA